MTVSELIKAGVKAGDHLYRFAYVIVEAEVLFVCNMGNNPYILVQEDPYHQDTILNYGDYGWEQTKAAALGTARKSYRNMLARIDKIEAGQDPDKE